MACRSPYRPEPTALQLDPEPAFPVGCPCGCSVETRIAYSALGGWWHTDACDQWRAWYARRTGREIDRIDFDRTDLAL